MSNSLWTHGLQPTRLLWPWDSLDKNTRVGCHFLLQEIFPTQGSNPCLLHCRQILYHRVTRCEVLTRWKRLRHWERLKARRGGRQRMRWLEGINSVDMNLSKLWNIVEDRGAWQATVGGVAKHRVQLSDWMKSTPGDWTRQPCALWGCGLYQEGLLTILKLRSVSSCPAAL